MIRELDYTELKKFYNKKDFDFKTTKDLEPYNDLVGQERASKALKFGINMKAKGYNIYISGALGSGKTNFAKKYAIEKAKTESIPPDLCYIYNFKNPKEPKKLLVEHGSGVVLKEDMEDLINTITNELPKLYISNDFDKRKMSIIKKFQAQRDKMIKFVNEEAKKRKFGVRYTREGIYFVPFEGESLITEEQFEALSETEKDDVEKISSEIQESVYDIMKDLKSLEKKVKKEIDDIEFSEGLFLISHYIGKLIEKYSENQDVIQYLTEAKEDILNNLDEFIVDDISDEEATIQNMIPWSVRKSTEDIHNRYKINVLVDNAKLEGAPVIVGYNPTYVNLIGETEYDSEFGNMSTDFMKIKPGLLHKANGGYLILHAREILSNSYSWEALRRVLSSEKISIEPIKEYSTGLVLSGIKPEESKINLKIIMVGTGYYYDLLNYYDEEFRELFKIIADFDIEMLGNENNVKNTLGFIKNFITKENLKEFDIDGVLKIIEHSERLSGSKNKLTSIFSDIVEILIEANAWSEIDGEKIVTKKYVNKAIEEKYYRSSLYEEKLNELLDENIVMISTNGKKIGQINALSVIDMGDYTFGKPSRVTATTCLGKTGVIDIENESEMSGNIHNKGVQVLSGYLGQKYAQDFPLNLSSRICFEQNYNGIDGDSASSAELYAIISSASGIPVNQEVAVTGSINQFGEIQAIGGVNFKIEGFFDLCKKRGLTGTQGVIIPERNVNDLVLKDEVIEAVRNKEFHIYPINYIDEGLEILLGEEAGELDEKGKFPPLSIHGKVYKKLKKFYKSST